VLAAAALAGAISGGATEVWLEPDTAPTTSRIVQQRDAPGSAAPGASDNLEAAATALAPESWAESNNCGQERIADAEA